MLVFSVIRQMLHSNESSYGPSEFDSLCDDIQYDIQHRESTEMMQF